MEFARRIALRLLESRLRTEQELREALTKKNVPDDVTDALLERFRDVGLVDDAAFAAALVNTRSQVGLRGRSRIAAELRSKGVEREVAEAALGELATEDELEAALALAARKARGMRGLEPHVASRRLYGALARRGFSPGITRTAVTSAVGEWLGSPEDSDDVLAVGED